MRDRKTRFRFGIRSMLIVVSLLAVLLTFWPRVYEWFYSVPLSDAVSEFNLHAVRYVPILTEQEIVDCITWRLPRIKIDNEAKELLARIAKEKRLPRNASIEGKKNIVRMEISLRIPLSNNGATTFLVRGWNSPFIKLGKPDKQIRYAAR